VWNLVRGWGSGSVPLRGQSLVEGKEKKGFFSFMRRLIMAQASGWSGTSRKKGGGGMFKGVKEWVLSVEGGRPGR